MVVKWPGTIKPGRVVNDITAGEDFLPTFLAAAGEPDIKGKLLNGLKVGDKTFKTHLDGYNFLPFLKGDVAEGPRKEFFYFTDGSDLNAVRYNGGIDQRSNRDQPSTGSVGTLPGPVDELWQVVGRKALDDGSNRRHRRRVPQDI